MKHERKSMKLDKIERQALREALVFELGVRFVSTYLLLPFFSFLLKLTYRLAGFNYVRSDNLSAILRDPLALLYVLLIWIFFGLCLVFEMSGLIMITSPYSYPHTSIRADMREAWRFTWRSLRRHPFAFLLIVLLLAPLLSGIYASPILPSIEIPSFIMDSILQSTWQTLALIALIALQILLFFMLAFTLHEMVLRDKEPIAALRSSFATFRKKGLQTFLLILRKMTFVSLVLAVTLFLALALLFLLLILLIDSNFWTITLLSLSSLFINITGWLLGAFLTAYFWAWLSRLYRRYASLKPASPEGYEAPVAAVDLQAGKIQRRKRRLKIAFSLLIFVAVLAFEALRIHFALSAQPAGELIPADITTNKVRITAHRGVTKKAVENSLASVAAAIEDRVDDVEIDIQITKDGQVVLFHDSNLRRLTGDRRVLEDCTYAELQALQLKSKTSAASSTPERIPLLHDVLLFGKNKVRFNIEFKSSKAREVELVKAAVRLVQELEMTDQVFFASLKLSPLQEVKRLDPQLKTCYILPFVRGDFFELEEIDFYSIEASNITADLVQQVHSKGKELLVWTVNDEESMNKVLKSGAKNIITDDTLLARENILLSQNNFQFDVKLLDVLVPALEDAQEAAAQ